MSGILDVTPSNISAQAGAFAGIAGDTTDALEQLRATLTGLGNVWGSDEQGDKFGSTYVPNTAAVEANLERFVAATKGINAGLTEAAAGYAETDSANCDSMRPAGGRP